MIKGFEIETEPLTDYEAQTLLPVILRGLHNKRGQSAAVTNKTMVAGMKAAGYKLSDTRVRKIINHIRTHGLIEGLIATSNGYYITDSPEEITSYIASLKGREDAIRQVRHKMEQYAQKLTLK